MFALLLAAVFLYAGPSANGSALQDQAWVTVAEDGGRVWGRFLPGPERYEPGCGPGVGSRERGLRTAQGEPIDSLDLVGWKEDDAWRIVVYALLAGAPDPAGTGECRDDLKRREVASVRLRPGEEAVLAQMKAIGARPWRVAVVLR